MHSSVPDKIVDQSPGAKPTACQPHRRCLHCQHDLHGLTEPTCPECGTPFDPDAPITDEIYLEKNFRKIVFTLLATPVLTLGAVIVLFLISDSVGDTQVFTVVMGIAYTLLILSCPLTLTLASIRATQQHLIGHARPPAFQTKPLRALFLCTMYFVSFLIVQGILILVPLFFIIMLG